MQTIHYNISDKKALSTPDKPVLVAGESGTSEIVLSTVPAAWDGFEIRALLTTPTRILVDAFAVGNGFPLTNTMLDAQGYLYIEFVAYRGGTEIDRSLPDKLYVNAGRKAEGDIDPAPLPDLVAEMVAAKGDCDGAAASAVLATERIETTDAAVQAAEVVRAVDEEARKDAEEARAGFYAGFNAGIAEINKFSNQEDFCKTLLRNGRFNKLFTVSCLNAALYNLSVVFDIGDNRGIEYTTGRRSNADYVTLQNGKIGAQSIAYAVFEYLNYASKTGTWNTMYPPTYYASAVGATFTQSFFGAGLDFNFMGDTRGGVWKFVLDGNEAGAVLVSTYRATTAYYVSNVFRLIENGQHTVVATFMGDDPAHTPSGGAGTSRGWCNYDVSATVKTMTTYKATESVTADITPLFGDSNKEFAIDMYKSGMSIDHFTPFHDVQTDFAIAPVKIIIDGAETTMTTAQMITGVSELKIVQQIYGRNPESEDNLIKVTTVTTFRDGYVSVDGKIEFLTDVFVRAGYGIMFPFSNIFADKIINSIGNIYSADLSDGTVRYLAEEKDRTTGFVVLSNTYKNIAIAINYNNPKETLRIGKPGKNTEDKRLWLQYRNADMIKLYQQLWTESSVVAGTIFRFSGTFVIAECPNLSDLF